MQEPDRLDVHSAVEAGYRWYGIRGVGRRHELLWAYVWTVLDPSRVRDDTRRAWVSFYRPEDENAFLGMLNEFQVPVEYKNKRDDPSP